MTDFLTIAQACSQFYLTKVFHADGSVDSYDDAASYKFKEVQVADIAHLSAILTKSESKQNRCVVRGKFVGEERAEKSKVPGTYVRQNINLEEVPHHWVMIDIDRYEVDFGDPVHEPIDAILDFICQHLPACFHGRSFHWQLSSSAGTPGKERILKAHVWFWLETPYTGPQLTAWAKPSYSLVDTAVFRRAQIHYTASPVFEDGARDPVPVRSGLYRGPGGDTVPLVIPAEVLAQTRTSGTGSGGNDMALVDPSLKEGMVGLFHRVFSADEVLQEILEGEFEAGPNERRWTWLNGGGTPEGVWVHQDGMHVHAVHHTWPLSGIANLWDLVRVFKFGHLDKVEGGDDFEQLDLESLPIQAKPSHLAMMAWVSSLPKIQEEIRLQRQGKLEECLQAIQAVADAHALEMIVAPALKEEEGLSVTDRERLASAFQTRMKDLAGVKLPIAQVRRLLAPASHRTTAEDAPDWATRWVWVREDDGFMNTDTKRVISERSYNASYDRFMGIYADENGNVPRASEMALTAWQTMVVDQAVYLPSADEFFWMDGVYCINLYRKNLVPELPKALSTKEQEAIRIVEAHAELMVPDARERRLLLDWIAYCVQKPGAKIRWAVLLKGIPGDGKTAFATLLSYCMGHPNVRTLSSNTLEGSNFSAWAAGQCVVAIEEVKIQGVNRYDVFNKLKPYITNDVVEIHPKGKDPRNVPNTSNYFLLTNHDDALPLDDNDRRIMPLWSPFVAKEQLFGAIEERFGMEAGDYFDRLFDNAIKAHPGALRKWLMERELSAEFKADGRAPVTAARELMVDISKGDEVIAVEECLRIGGEGIYPNLVSVTHLEAMVKTQFDLSIRTRLVKNIMSELGFAFTKRITWKGRDCRIYRKAGFEVSDKGLQKVLDAFEDARQSAEIEAEFCD